ncbi:unnamed protein product [Timema podura]|uniref:Ionotropic glutamate receptor C-terminal domain-containing protein n=1 Tax=Timema podura TaxID=61482 RepID=A0ABN7NUG7_TIMPD|nr:unnamed protein product [Timema podura]
MKRITSDVELWGSKQLNGTFSGLIGEVVSGSADVALGNLHYTQYHLDLMDLTKPYITECLTFLTPESLTDNSWMTLILPFKVYMWITVILTLFVGGFVFYALARFQKYLNSPHSKLTEPEKNIPVKKLLVKDVGEQRNVIQEQKVHTESESAVNAKEESGLEGLYLFGDLRNGILYTYSMLLLVSLPKLPTGWSIRVLTGWWWMYCILVVTAYRASMTAILANPAPRVTIDTLDQLATNPISCGGWGEQNKDFFLTSLDTAGRKIGEKFEVIHDTNSALDRVSKGTFAFYDNIYFLRYASVKKQSQTEQNKSSEDKVSNTDQSNSVDRNLHIMRDCAINMPISIGLRKNSPLKLQMDKFILRMIEAGLIKKWLNDVMLVTFSAEIPDQGESTKALMDLRKLYGAFVALGLGYFLSISMLIVEQIYWKYVVTKSPYFDKYNRKMFYANKI